MFKIQLLLHSKFNFNVNVQEAKKFTANFFNIYCTSVKWQRANRIRVAVILFYACVYIVNVINMS